MPNVPEPPDELLRLFDENDNEVEPRTRQWIWDNKPGLRHAAGTIWLINKQGQLLCSKRSATMRSNPSKWQTYFGGKVPVGSTCRDTAMRELEEEAGITVESGLLFTVQESERIGRYIYPAEVVPEDFVSPDGEISEVRWLSIEEFHEDEAAHPEDWCNVITDSQEKRIREWIAEAL